MLVKKETNSKNVIVTCFIICFHIFVAKSWN
jgi:hypothetical protein